MIPACRLYRNSLWQKREKAGSGVEFFKQDIAGKVLRLVPSRPYWAVEPRRTKAARGGMIIPCDIGPSNIVRSYRRNKSVSSRDSGSIWIG